MYALVQIAGQHFKVAKDHKVLVHRLAGEEGSSVTFDQVLLRGNDKELTVGGAAIDGAQVEAKILRHHKGDKVIVPKKKRRKADQEGDGHRDVFAEVVGEGKLAG